MTVGFVPKPAIRSRYTMRVLIFMMWPKWQDADFGCMPKRIDLQ